LRLTVKVIPNARRTSFTQLDDGSWAARVAAPAVDGKANDALVALIAAHFKIPRSRVTIIRGATSRHKIVEVVTPAVPAP
jgi:uncharacterized protein (TIGR00251 family)